MVTMMTGLSNLVISYTPAVKLLLVIVLMIIGAGCMILHFIEFCLDFCCKTDSAKNTDNSTKSNMNTITTDKKEAK